MVKTNTGGIFVYLLLFQNEMALKPSHGCQSLSGFRFLQPFKHLAETRIKD